MVFSPVEPFLQFFDTLTHKVKTVSRNQLPGQGQGQKHSVYLKIFTKNSPKYQLTKK